MSVYTVSQLAHDAGVNVHVVRDYLLRGSMRRIATKPPCSLPCYVSSLNAGARRWPTWTRNWLPCRPSRHMRKSCHEYR